jgi:transposase
MVIFPGVKVIEQCFLYSRASYPFKHSTDIGRGKILVIWDGSPIHRSKETQVFLKIGAAKRLYLEPLPCYAPDLNPEGMAHRTR